MSGTPIRAGQARRPVVSAALPVLVAGPILAACVLYVVGFTAWTTWLSFTDSTILPDYALVGWKNYTRLLSNRVFQVAYVNLVVYGVGFIGCTMAVGLLLAILIDQKIRAETVFRTVFLYPMAVSFVVTGTVWAWLLNPTIGIERFARSTLGLDWFRFGWLVDRDMAIYAIVIAAVWQASGFAMALFLSGLRSLDPDLYKAAAIDGAGAVRLYARIIVPAMWPTAISVAIILLQFAIKTYDLVRALTSGGPGIATTLPTLVVYDYMFQRGLMGAGAAAAVMLLMSLVVIAAPCAFIRHLARTRREAVNQGGH